MTISGGITERRRVSMRGVVLGADLSPDLRMIMWGDGSG